MQAPTLPARSSRRDERAAMSAMLLRSAVALYWLLLFSLLRRRWAGGRSQILFCTFYLTWWRMFLWLVAKVSCRRLLLFVAGLLVDLADGGPLGYWALIYMLGLLITRQMSGGLGQTVLGRLSGVVFIVFALAAGQVVVASLFQLKWIDWHVVLAATAIAGLIGAVFDLAWPTRSSDKASNMMIRGGG